MSRRWVFCLLLAGAPAWAAEPESLDDAIERLAGTDYEARTAAPDLHAIFYMEDPDRFIATAGVWWARLKGPIRFDNDVVLDVSDTLGLRARKSVPFTRLAWRVGWLEIVFEGFWYDNAGATRVEEEFEIDGVVFEVGDIIDSDIKIHSYRFTLGFTLMRRDWMTLTLQVGASAIYTEGSITAVNVDKAATWEQWLPLPLIGASAKGYFIKYPWIYEIGFGWVGFSRKALGAAAIDVRGAIGYQFNDWVNFNVGYRFLGIRAGIEEVNAEIDLSGFYLELALTF